MAGCQNICSSLQQASALQKSLVSLSAIFMVASAIIVGLGASHIFGSLQGVGTLSALVGGGLVFLASVAVLVKSSIQIAKTAPKKSVNIPHSEEPAPIIIEEAPVVVPVKAVPIEVLPYPLFGQKAIDFALEMLEKDEYKDISIEKFRVRPKNTQVEKLYALATLFMGKVMTAEGNEKLRSGDAEAREIYDSAIKIAYAASCLTLDELPALEEKTHQSYARLLTEQLNCFAYRVFYTLPVFYDFYRSGYLFISTGRAFQDKNTCLPPERVEQFYVEGTLEASWRQLYNDFCDRLRSYIPGIDEMPYNEADQRLSKHAGWDKSKETYKRYHGPLPT